MIFQKKINLHSHIKSSFLLNLINFSYLKIAIFIFVHDFEYSFKENDKLSKRYSNLELWKIILSGILPVVFQIGNETVLSVYSVIFGLIRLIIYYIDQTYYSERVSCFYSILNVFYLVSSIIFCIF